jgi:thiol-disulfide isomerase/thioredoxin
VTTDSRIVLYRVVFAIALLLAAGAGGFFTYRLVEVHTSPAHLTAWPAQTAARAPAPAGTVDSTSPEPAPARTIPERLPQLSLADRDGVRRTLSHWKGRPLLVNFWATWCAPCRREIPLLKSLRRERSADALEIVGIAVDFRDAVLRYAHDIGIDYPVLIGEQDGLDAVGAFGMDAIFPFTVFADREGRIVTLKIGELHRDEANLILDRLHDLDQGRLELRAAREQIAAGMRQLAIERARAAPTPSPRDHQGS